MIYNIKTISNFSEKIEAENDAEAIAQFATNMDSDMNLYFKAIPADNANDLTEREEELDEPELMFTCESGQKVYYDLSNFLSDYADGNYFVSDKISDVEVYGKAQNLRLNITSMFKLACILDAEDKYHFRGTASSYSCDPTGSHTKHDKSYYLDKYNDTMAKCEEVEKRVAQLEGVEYKREFAYTKFDELCDAEDIVGYYITHYGDEALEACKRNFKDIEMTEEKTEIIRILEYLYTSEPYAISPQTALTVLAANMPKDFSGFNSETESGEPEHLMDLPNGRTLKIVYQDTGDVNRYYSWQVLYSDEEFTKHDFNSDDKVIAKEDVDSFDYDTVYGELDWAIRIAKETPIRKKYDIRVGEEVYVPFGDEKTIAYVVDTDEKGEVFTVCLTDKKKFHTIHFDSIDTVERTGRINDMITHLF